MSLYMYTQSTVAEADTTSAAGVDYRSLYVQSRVGTVVNNKPGL